MGNEKNTSSRTPGSADRVQASEPTPARCPRCGGADCDECSHTGQAEFCSADPFQRIYREQREALAAIRRGAGFVAHLGLADWVMEEVLLRLKQKEQEKTR